MNSSNQRYNGLSQIRFTGESALSEHKAEVAAAYEECSGDTIIMLGEGDHTSQTWRLTDSLRRKLILELSEIEYRKWFLCEK